MSNVESDRVDWSAYAEVYDLMSRVNPAYQELLELFDQQVSDWRLAAGSVVVDIGGGTGNFACRAARRFSDARVILLDPSEAMTDRASDKATAAGLDNLEVLNRPFTPAEFDDESVDAVICVHSLYTLPRPQEALFEVHRWMKPQGKLFVCDIGRVLDMGDWARYLFAELCRRHGLPTTLATFWRGRVVARENRRIARSQSAGVYWTHGTGDFAKRLAAVGFTVQHLQRAYRDYSDLAVCSKP